MTGRIYRLAPIVVGILLTVWIAFGLSRLTWTLAGFPPLRAVAAQQMVVRNRTQSASVAMDAILAFAPFGKPAETTGPGAGASVINSTFLLQGISLAANPSASLATISTPGGRPKAYLPGEALPGGAILSRIEANQVMIRVNGREEILTFPAPISAPKNLATAVGVASAASPLLHTDSPIDEVIVQARQRIAQNPQTLLDDLGVKAGSGGYQIGPSASAMTLRAGFKPGDVVTTVNGVAVGNVESDRTLFENVVASGSARVEVVRNGKVTVLTFPLR